MCANSALMDNELDAGTIKYTSSAYLHVLLSGVMAVKSDAQIIKADGPTAEP